MVIRFSFAPDRYQYCGHALNLSLPGIKCMKSKIPLLLLLCIVFGHASAQRYSAGVYSGMNMTFLETEAMQTKAQQIARSAGLGVFMTKQLNRRYSLQLEINYTRMGERIDGMQALTDEQVLKAGAATGTALFGHYRTDMQLHYLQLPVLLKATIPFSPSLSYYALIGPSASWLVSPRRITTGTSMLYTDLAGTKEYMANDVPVTFSIDERTRLTGYRDIMFSAIGALGINLRLPDNGRIYFESRIQAGFSNIYKRPETQGENYTNAVGFYLGYIFNL